MLGTFPSPEAIHIAKRDIGADLDKIAGFFQEDARKIDVGRELEGFREAAHNALQELPVPQEIMAREERNRQVASRIARSHDIADTRQALAGYAQGTIAEVVSGGLSSIGKQHIERWEKHRPQLEEATERLFEALFDAKR
jgi:hypothetical protein